MQGVSVLLFLGILAKWSCSAVFLNHRPFPTYSLEDMPATQFSCREKILGGYYADPDAQCQMFHICVKVAGIGVQDFRFLCPNGTAFDQDHQICADWEDVDCDATTLYYSSDNFDLYRVGSGFESKAHKYGEDEETFALQRAETGDPRINRDPQTPHVINQQKQTYQSNQPKRNFNNNNQNNNNNNNNQDKDIFKASSSSNFFNNRNNGKETDEDYDDNVNVNQNRDFEQKRKIVRKQQRRPAQQQQQEPQQTQQPQQQQNNQQASAQQQASTNNNNGQNQQQQQQQAQTRRPQRPTGFSNNFAGSSYVPTTQRPVSSTAAEQHTVASTINSTFRRGQRQRVNQVSTNQNTNTPSYTVSTPAPFRQSPSASRQTSQNNNNGQYYTSSTENYPQPRPTNAAVNYNTNYDVSKISKQNTDNYPSNNPQYSKSTTPFASSQYNTAVDKKPTSPKKFENYKPTTFSPNAKPFSIPSTQQQNSQNTNSGFPSTFAPRTQQAYTQIAQQTGSYNSQKTQRPTTFNQSPSSSTFNQQSSSTFAQQYNSPSSTQRATTFTQYTPTVPKISSTTPVTRSSRFDETQYDDGAYDSKFESSNSGGEDEFLKTAHSQNIASSRNELARTQKQSPSTTQKPSYEAPRTYSTTAYTARPTENYPKSSQFASTSRNIQRTQKPVESKPQAPVKSGKKVKDVSYDYAYYDSLGPEPDYHIDTEVQKTKN